MQLWAAEIKELETLHSSVQGRFPELEKELGKLVKADDENMVLIYSRRCLEVIITDLCEFELKRPRKTEPLKGIIDKLNREEKVPSNIIASMQSLNSLSTFGAHPKEFDPEQVRPVLINLTTIIRWYLKYKDTRTISKPAAAAEAAAEKYESEVRTDSTEGSRIPKKRLILLLSGLLLVCVIIIAALFKFDIIGSGKQTIEIEKSIAVLPFISMSDDPEKQYLADGMMDAILLHLSKIEDLRVMSRTSVEQYRKTDKTTSVIGKELGVAYLLEGSFQKYGDNARLIVQLIKTGEEGHVWANDYDRNWNDIFSVQSEVAQAIANELHAVITPEEKQIIEKIPTTSLTAYDFYQRGREEDFKSMSSGEFLARISDKNKKEALERAADFYHIALEYDSTFAQAYTGLAKVYWNKHYWETFFSENFMDSVMILTDIALSIDDQLSEAYTLKGHYYSETGNPEQAIKEYDRAIKFNPNNWEAYYRKGQFYLYNDLVKSIDNLQKATSLNRGAQLPGLLRDLGWSYIWAGFTEKANHYFQEAFKLDGDSVEYFLNLGATEYVIGNNKNAIEFFLKGYTIDSNNTLILVQLGSSYMSLGQYEESLKYFNKYVERLKVLGGSSLNQMHRIGYVYWQNGYKEEAEYYFNEQINYCNRMNELGRSLTLSLFPYYDLAGVYAFRGEKDKAYENLRIYNNQRKIEIFGIVTLIKIDPLFDSIRDEPEFQQIVRDVEAKYQVEHERVRKWLEEQGEL